MAFPKMFYRSDGSTTIVTTQAEENALSGAWWASPAEFGYISAPSVDQLDLGTATAFSYAPNGIQATPTGGAA